MEFYVELRIQNSKSKIFFIRVTSTTIYKWLRSIFIDDYRRIILVGPGYDMSWIFEMATQKSRNI